MFAVIVIGIIIAGTNPSNPAKLAPSSGHVTVVSSAEDKAYEREFSAFSYIDNSVKKIIITNDDIDYSTSTVYHYKLKDFLMMDEL